MKTSAESSFTHFLLVKWFVFVPLVLLLVYSFIDIFAGPGGFVLPNVAKWLPLALIGAGESLIVMYLWFRLGRAAWRFIVPLLAVIPFGVLILYFLMVMLLCRGDCL